MDFSQSEVNDDDLNQYIALPGCLILSSGAIGRRVVWHSEHCEHFKVCRFMFLEILDKCSCFTYKTQLRKIMHGRQTSYHIYIKDVYAIILGCLLGCLSSGDWYFSPSNVNEFSAEISMVLFSTHRHFAKEEWANMMLLLVENAPFHLLLTKLIGESSFFTIMTHVHFLSKIPGCHSLMSKTNI